MAGLAALGLAVAAQAEPLPTEQALKDRVLGDPGAPLTIIEYASLTCPSCAKFHNEVLPQVKKDWIDTGRAKLIYRDYPTNPVALALYAAMVARCAPEDRYFSYLEVFYKQQRSWGTSADPLKALAQLARLGGMSQADFDACTGNEELFTGIRERALDGRMEYGVESTPSFVIDGQVIRGVLEYADFNKVLEDAAK
ncbi:MAG: DsbA family protein [Rhodospirillales bacterium]|nr:MAG: DsbA family protein [Rhodospirillales bacterium]UCH74366.1 MAG: DsbA family protein [Rhodospirillales bacterium]